MNKYGQPLAAPIRQTILPAMTKDGRIIGWYPIAAQTFTGAETSVTIPDTGNGGAGTVVPVMSVTQDSDIGLPQYMAAVWPTGLAANYQPWASTLLQKPDVGYSRWYSMATESWFEHFTKGALIDGLTGGTLNLAVSAASNPSAPTVTTPAAQTWQASIEYAMLNGDCPFFDFNWITLFAAKSNTTGIRIVVNTNPAPIAPDPLPPMKAVNIGIPVAGPTGAPIYDSIRIMKLMDEVPPGAYAFTFTIYDDLGQSTAATLNLTVV